MKRLFAVCLLGVLVAPLFGQAVDTTVCDILKNPVSFNGKTVRLKATVSAGFDHFVILGQGCGQRIDAIWLDYPEGTKAKSGPAAVLTLQPAKNFAGTVPPAPARTPVTLEANADFKQFDTLLSTPLKPGGMCLGCIRYQVTATLVGRLDGVQPLLQRTAAGKIAGLAGFGNLNAYPARLVLQSVTGITTQEINSGKLVPGPDPGPAAQAADRVSVAFASGVLLQDHPKRAAAAFGKPGENNGVEVSFGGGNEATAALEAQSAKDSPDGIVWNVIFDSSRLKGDSMTRALTHIGEHIVDLRTPESLILHAGLHQLEFRAWLTTMMGAVAAEQVSIYLPGGYPLWKNSWDSTNLNANAESSLSGFFANQAGLDK